MIIDKPGMAWTGRVVSVAPIEGADRIQRTEVICGHGGRWTGVTPKTVVVDEHVTVFVQDAVVPQSDVWRFMEKRNWRVSMCRLRGCPSEVLIMPTREVNPALEAFEIGTDVTTMLGVKKYEKEIHHSLAGKVVGPLPSFIPKTDEINFQQAPELVEALIGKPYYITEKYDGASCTFYWHDGHFGCCTRNLELARPADGETPTAPWIIARRYGLDTKRPPLESIAIQCELIGPGIQSNCLKLTDIDIRVFDVYDIIGKEYLNHDQMKTVCELMGVPWVKTIVYGQEFHVASDDDLRATARIKYVQSGTIAEGIVIRSTETDRVNGQRLSFKVINLDYKD